MKDKLIKNLTIIIKFRKIYDIDEIKSELF